jgi:hypothetical protein
MAPRARRGGELDSLKGRIAEAFVESIFRRAGYRVSRDRRESPPLPPLKLCGDELLPDFYLHKPAGETSAGRARRRLIPIEVRYEARVEDFLESHDERWASALRTRWPELRIVCVTDHPAAGRSCFQVLDVAAARPDAPLATVDLHYVHDFDIYLTTAQEYETLVREIYPLLRLGGRVAPSPGAPA